MIEETEDHEFTPGDVVRLKSGGPLMTVTKFTPKTEDMRANVDVCWFSPGDQSRPIFWCFPPAALVIHEDGK